MLIIKRRPDELSPGALSLGEFTRRFVLSSILVIGLIVPALVLVIGFVNQVVAEPHPSGDDIVFGIGVVSAYGFLIAFVGSMVGVVFGLIVGPIYFFIHRAVRELWDRPWGPDYDYSYQEEDDVVYDAKRKAQDRQPDPEP